MIYYTFKSSINNFRFCWTKTRTYF